MFVFILTLNGLYSQGVAICATIAAPIHFGDAFHNLDVVIVSCSWKVKNSDASELSSARIQLELEAFQLDSARLMEF